MSDAVIPAMDQTLSNLVQQEPTLLGIPTEIRILILQYLLLSDSPISSGPNSVYQELPCCQCKEQVPCKHPHIGPPGSEISLQHHFDYIDTKLCSKPSTFVNVSILATCKQLRNEGLSIFLQNTITISCYIWNGVCQPNTVGQYDMRPCCACLSSSVALFVAGICATEEYVVDAMIYI